MQEVKTNKGKFKFWDSIKELPINRFNDFNKYIVQAVGIGSTIQDVENHYRTIDLFLANGKIDEARMERYNLHYNLFLMLNGIQITDFCFLQFVQSINDEPIHDYSEGNLINLSKILGDIELNRGQVEDILDSVKKKLIPR